ncbi:MAG TPA: glycosyltransferase family 1 protein [Candidatus Dormibacteraeota bacterium]|nr:glycosyltransferase family 1 protein [Candidatus Dormibacteraeota bacterium]
MGPTVKLGFDGSVASVPGGTATYAVQLVRNLLDQHPDWDFYLYFRTPNPINQLEAYGMRPNVHVRFLGAGPNLWRVQSIMPSRLRADGIDVFHSPGYFLPISWGGPQVVTIHDLNIYRQIWARARSANFLGWLDLAVQTPLAAWRAERVIVDSTSGADDVCKLLRISRTKVDTIPLAADPFYEEAPTSTELKALTHLVKARPYVLYAGVLSRPKNLENLIRAFHTSELATSGVDLLLAGSDHHGYGRILERTATELGLSQNVRLLGFVSQPMLRALYSESLCTVLPSYGEGFGLPLVEAMACGAPIVAADRQSMPEVIGTAGPLFEPGDTTGLASILHRIANDPDHRRTLQAGSKQRKLAFSWTRTAESTAAAYLRACRDRSGSEP